MNAIQITSQIIGANEVTLKKFGEKAFSNIRASLLGKCQGLSKEDTVKRLTLLYSHGDQIGLTAETRLAALATINYL